MKGRCILLRSTFLPILLLALLTPMALAQVDLVPIAFFDFEETIFDRGFQYGGKEQNIVYDSCINKLGVVFDGKDSRILYGAQSIWTFSQNRSFTIEFWIKTSQRPDDVATVMIARNSGERPSWSFVLAGKGANKGRRDGHLSFELWTWGSQRINSKKPINDGEWHLVEGYFHTPTRKAVLIIDDEVQGDMKIASNYNEKVICLTLGGNLDPNAAQSFEGALDTLRMYHNVRDKVSGLLEIKEKVDILSRESVEAGFDAWIARNCKPRPLMHKSAEEWNKRRLIVKEQLTDMLGLTPWPCTKSTRGDQLPLNAREGMVKEYDDFTVRGLIWQSWKGIYCRGLLYLPKTGNVPYPAVLNPHGHFTGGMFNEVVQSRCIMLARMGFVALSVESMHPEDLAIGMTPLSGMIWNDMRALDYLLRRTDVDAGRIGCTGASGGGQQTMMLMCLDDRIQAAAPVCMACCCRDIVSNPDSTPRRSWTHCNCNWVPNIVQKTDLPEIAAVFAPKPCLYITTASDFTRFWPHEGYLDVARVYNLLGKKDNLYQKHYEQPHGYHKNWREEMYSFFNIQLNNGAGKAKITESEELPILSRRELEILFTTRPFTDLQGTLSKEFRTRLGAPEMSVPSSIDEALEAQRQMRKRLRGIMSEDYDKSLPLKAKIVKEAFNKQHRVQALHFETEPGIIVPAIRITKKHTSGPYPLVILVNELGKTETYLNELVLVSSLVEWGCAVLIPDLRYNGELGTCSNWHNAYGQIFGRTETAVAVHDLMKIVSSTKGQDVYAPLKTVLMGIENGSVVALLTAGLDTNVNAVGCSNVGRTYREGRSEPLLTGILRVGDLPDIACLLAPRPLFWAGVENEEPYQRTIAFSQVLNSPPLITSMREDRNREGLLAWYPTLFRTR
jgi:dienelactone hydrolase